MSTPAHTELVGRRNECDALDQVLADVIGGRSRVLVLRGDAGAGKSALLGYLSERLVDSRSVRAVGVESEMELPYSSLHQLCAQLLDHLDDLPAPQRDALATVFGRSAGPPPDPFLVGLATLGLLAEAAEQQPLFCIVDDAHWLDQSSAQILGFVGRRLLAERVALICAVRTGVGDTVLAGLPEMSIDGLGDSDARALLLRNMHGPLDAAVCEQIITESHGNPLALLELPRTWKTEEIAGGFGLPDGHPVTSKIEQSYAERLFLLPADTQLLVLAAAAEPLGDPILLHRAAETLGVGIAAAEAAEDAGLLHVRVRVEFAHPLVRSASYHSASADDRRRVHRALAEATDADTDPDRRAWHRARATPGPDEEVAAELERSAGRAQARGGLAAAGVFLRRAVALTGDPARRAGRALAAAEVSLQSGAFEAALAMLATAEAGEVDDLERARIELVRGRIVSASSFGSAGAQLLKAATQLEPLDIDLARATYLEAWGTALAAGDLGDGALREVSQAVRAAPAPAHEPYSTDLLVDGLARLVVEGLAPAAPTLRKAVSAFRTDDQVLFWGAMAATAAAAVWDMESFDAVLERQVQLARGTGALALLVTALQGRGIVVTWCGDFVRATSITAEADAVTDATGVRIAPYGGMLLAAFQGREDEASALFAKAAAESAASGEGLGVQYAQWATALLSNGLGRYAEALAAARDASEAAPELFVSHWALAELVEAAARSDEPDVAAKAADRLVEVTSASESDWGLGVAARARALASDDDTAEQLYTDAIIRLGRTPLRPEAARTQLLYGEWLRRQNRRSDARTQLRIAHEAFNAIGMEGFAERARIELLATGERVRKRTVETREELTPQEAQIARLARDGLSNPEIGARLFISARTVEWHLHKVFAKLGISSRRQLRATLPEQLTVV
jgi:DNA-binding CsgD family transcriptional regulator